ncbi:MAG: amidohydrolase [Desulfobacterales bacterium]|nr:MAG: amidohydrolase [Desulfobacterales bacterium]
MLDLLIHNGTAITVNDRSEILPNAVICIKDGKITDLYSRPDSDSVSRAGSDAHSGTSPASLPETRERLDADGGLILPGLINAHTHLPMSLFRGLADDLPLDEWLNEHIFPAEAARINPETVYEAAMLSCTELLQSGVTTCCDGYFHEEHVARAVKDAGLRAVLGQGIIDFPAPGVPDPARNIAAAEAFIQSIMDLSPRITPSVFCHSPYTCSENTLKSAKSLADRYGLLFQVHLAETRWERDRTLAEYGMGPARHLASLGILDERTLLVHCVWLKKEDIQIVADTGASVIHCPESNMKLGSGVAPVPEMIRSGIPVGIGTDGCASNNDQDMFREMDMTAKLHKVFSGDPTVMDAETVLRTATIDGARAIGLGAETGSLEKGKRADIIILDADAVHLTPMYHPVSHIVYAARGADVKNTIAGGEKLL